MIRFLTLVIGLSFAVPALAQQLLVSRPPVYHSGESYVGTVLVPNGMTYQYKQTARKFHAGKVLLDMEMSDSAGDVLLRGMMDPETFAHFGKSSTETIMTVTTTCSASALYPIVKDKRYVCAFEYEINGRKLAGTMDFRVLEPVRDARGRLLQFCMLVVSDDPEVRMKTKDCRSPDGKWTYSGEILEHEFKPAI